MSSAKTAVVFGYGEMGIRCLKVLLSGGVRVPLVVTHADSPNENIWFDSLQKTAHDYDIPVLIVEDVKDERLFNAIQKINPNYLYSFYYRFMLPTAVLDLASSGAYNMHGSLLPQYRGRAPTNWAISHGALEMGATLHLMTAKADAGAIIDQMAFPILENDLAHEVFAKTLTVAEIILNRSLPNILNGTATHKPNDITKGTYWGRRTPEDGRLLPTMDTRSLHNLIRAVAPPFPSAFFALPNGQKFFVQRTLIERTDSAPPLSNLCIYKENNNYYLQCEKGIRLKVLDCGFEQLKVTSAQDFFTNQKINLPWSFA